MNPTHRPRSRRAWSVIHGSAIAGLVAAAIVIGCGSTAKQTPRELLAESSVRVEAHLRETVTDPDRLDRALQILARYASAEEQFVDEASALEARMLTLHASYDATLEDYEAVLAPFHERRVAFTDELLETWVALTDVLETDEMSEFIEAQRGEEERWRALID